ncbi:ABC transporter ATP-binding protein [Aestuariimicrobium ganziense]|uniref:ABC transporter ATP-binding protein n=1 Tax=Aestuariimicrobium ganziense TaxID=2773677 RepID=UPI001942D2DD|nr:ABC transporter ATP-binding protein [Aestuariimicrobium ganziense]
MLRDLDLTITRGDFTVVMGPSGAGKSTLLHALSGMDQPTSGTIDVGGERISDRTPDQLATFRRRHCGFVFQQINLLDSMTLLDNVIAPGLLIDRDRSRVAARARELLAQVGIEDDTQTQFVQTLSGGEAQRAAVARALVNRPTVVFADEPTGQLNSENSRRVLDVLTQANRDGQTIVMVTHDLRSALRGNRVLYLRDGVVAGEKHLPPYQGDDPERETTMAAFLADLGW